MEDNLILENLQFSGEVKNLCSINERFDNEPYNVKEVRVMYGDIFSVLTKKRDEAGRSEAGRNYSIAITELENSCIRAIKWLYSK